MTTRARTRSADTQDVLQQLLEEIPEYRAAAGARRRLDQLEPKDTRTLAASMRDLVRAWALGEDDRSRDVVAAELGNLGAQIAGAEIIDAQLVVVADELRNSPEQIMLAHTPRLLSGLNEKMQDVVTQARRIGADRANLDLNHPSLTEDDIAASREFRRLSSMHGAIRQAQGRLIGTDAKSGIFDWSALFIKDIEETWPGYIVRKVASSINRLGPSGIPGWDHSSSEHAPPWEAITNSAALRFIDVGNPDFFAWAIAAGADLWVPTISQHQTETQRIEDLAQDAYDRVVRRGRGIVESPGRMGWTDPRFHS